MMRLMNEAHQVKGVLGKFRAKHFSACHLSHHVFSGPIENQTRSSSVVVGKNEDHSLHTSTYK